MAKNIKSINVTDQVKALRDFSAKNPYGETFLDNILMTFVKEGMKYVKKFNGEINMHFTAREEKDGKLFFSSENKIDKMEKVKEVNITLSELRTPRSFMNGKIMTAGGIIPVNDYDRVQLHTRSYSGGTISCCYKLMENEEDKTIGFYRDYLISSKRVEPEYVIELEKIKGIHLSIRNKFDEALFFSGFVNAMKNNLRKNDVETDEFMISECMYNFILSMYRNFELEFDVEVAGIPGCINFTTSLFSENALFADLTVRHKYLYRLDSFFRNTIYGLDVCELSKKQDAKYIALENINILRNSPNDLSWAIFEEVCKVREYVKKHFVLFKSLARHSLDDK